MIKENLQIFEKVFSRDFCLIALQIAMRCENSKNKPWQSEENPYEPYLIVERNDGTSNIYFNKKGVEFTIETLKEQIKNNTNFLVIVEEKVRQGIECIQPIYKKEEILSRTDLMHFIDDFIASYNWIEAMWWIKSIPSNETGIDHSRIIALRQETEKLSAGTEIVIRKSLESLYPKLGIFASMIRLEEFKSNNIPPINELQKRMDGFVLVNKDLLVSNTITDVTNKYDLIVEKESVATGNVIKGQIAYEGKVNGRVCRVMGHAHFDKMEEGMVLVSPMTMVDFLPLIKKAMAIITDEGGMLSHAAIVARELKKPCIIGTKIATKVLKDGDLVEVDAEKGVVTILKSAH